VRILLVALIGVASPAVAADYSPWFGRLVSHDTPLVEFVKAKKGGDSCCKHCTKGQPCGNTCISATAKCKSPPGCAC
jgi:hypothetical protein